jgi:hypothetical protein
MRNGLAPSHQQFKPTARRASIARQVSVTAFLARETVFNLVRAPQRTVLDPDNRPSSIVAAVTSLTATLDPVNICSLLGFRFASVDGFFGHVAGIVMILPRLLFARLLLVWVLIVGHRHTPWNFVSCRTITQLHERCSTLRVMAWHRRHPNRRGGRRSR